jgi:3-hydroxybutyryl-CoA dehydratase
MTIYLDDINVGDQIRSSGRTITETDVVNFAGLSGDFNPLHTDDDFAVTQSPFGRRVAHGMLGAAVSTGLRSPIDDWAILAFLETTRRFVAPIPIGTTVRFEAVVAEKRLSTNNDGRGVVSVDIRLVGGSSQQYQIGSDVYVVARSSYTQKEN